MEPFLFQLSGDPGEEALDLLLLFISVGRTKWCAPTGMLRSSANTGVSCPRRTCPPASRLLSRITPIPILAASMLIYDRSKLKMKFLCQPRTLCHDSQLLQLIKVLSEDQIAGQQIFHNLHRMAG